jgi:hypothetical protein
VAGTFVSSQASRRKISGSQETKILGNENARKNKHIILAFRTSRKGRMEASMITKIMVGIYAVVSLMHAVADEIAVKYMLAAPSGAANGRLTPHAK